MPLKPRNNDPVDLEALEPIALPLARAHQLPHTYFAEQYNPILHYWQILRKRKWVVLATAAIIFALSAISTLNTTRLYQATSKIAIFPENPNVLGFKDLGDSPSVDYQSEEALETQVAILRSDALAIKVMQAMHLDQDARLTGISQASPSAEGEIQSSGMAPDPAKAAGLLGAFRGGLSVQLVPGSSLVQISYTHPNPRLATEISNTLVTTFIEENFRTRYNSVTQTSEWLSKELLDLQLKVQTSEEKLVRYQKDHSILGVDEKQNIVTARLDELNRELTAAQTDRFQKESDQKLVAAGGDPSASTKPSPEGTSTLLDKLIEKEADLDTQYAEATTEFGSAYPKVAQLKNQLKQVRVEIEAEKARMRHKIGDQYLAAVQREDLLTSAFNQQKQEANHLNESSIEYSVLRRDAEANRQLYQDLLQRLKEAGVSAGLRSSNIRVVDVARIPTHPIVPDVQRNLALGLLLGLGLGMGLAFLLDSVDNTVRTIDEVSAVSTLPALGTIPLQISSNGRLRKKQLTALSSSNGNAESPALISYERPKSEAAEAFRALRTSILLSGSGTPPKVILLTSPLPQEGKTTVSSNCALVLAQRGRRVLLVDADLRRPGIGKLFGIKPRGGLSSLISGIDKVEDVVLEFPKVPNLWILPAGPIPPQPAELLGSTVMKELIAGWRSEFDHIIIDTPPCLSVTDAVALSPEADQVILVARSGQTTKPALRRACDLLLRVNASVMGIVVNALNTHSADGYYYYSYGGSPARSYYDNEKPPTDEVTTPTDAASKVS
jgi:polysaccharide biosynthesis transport protein